MHEGPPETVRERHEKEPEYVILYRYDNPSAPSTAPEPTAVSHPDLVGRWFTDNIRSLGTYILMRPPGGTVVWVQMPKSELEQWHVYNHPVARTMDVEKDNWILPDTVLADACSVPLPVPGSGANKFVFSDRQKVRELLEDLERKLQEDQKGLRA